MTTITSENRNAWQALADSCKPQFPSRGKTVEVIDGRKNKGKVGKVTWHGRNKYFDTRYYTEARLHLMDMRGREGYSVKIETESGETFFVPAEYTRVFTACDYLTASDLWEGAQ